MRQGAAACLALGVLGAARVHATDLNGEIGIGAIYTDNIRLAPKDTQSAAIGVATTDFLLHEETRRLVGDVAADLQYLTFEHAIYRNQVLGDLSGFGKFALVPGRIDWVLQDNFGQQQITPGVPVTPLNLEYLNYVSTGPDFSVPLGSQVQAQVSGRYSKISYQLGDLNNDRGNALFALVHPLSANSNVSLNGNAERVSYNGGIEIPDYTTRQGYLHYDAKGARSRLDFDVGYNNATIMGSTSGSALVRAIASRVLSASSSIELSAGQDISDAGNLLRQMQGTSNVTLAAASLLESRDPFVSRYARALWRFERNRTGLALSVSEFRESHDVQRELDRTRTEVDATAKRDLSRALALSIAAVYAHDSYDNRATPNDTYAQGTIDLAWRAGRRVEVHAQYARIDQRSDVVLNSYKENRFLLTVGLATENWTGLTVSKPNITALPPTSTD